MTFTSVTFLVFFACFLVLWPRLRGESQRRWGLICVASFVFYGWWDWRFALLLFATGALDFYVARAIAKWPERGGLLLVVSLISNLGVLGFFKYAVLARSSFVDLGWLEAGSAEFVDRIVLPVGISFYTFQALSYTIDVYRGHIKPVGNLLHFWAYLSFFPQLVAGPIVRAQDFIPQLEGPGTPSSEGRWTGLELIILGFFKKAVVADNLAPFVSKAYADVSHQGGLFWWIVTACFALQIFCDFSGYSDIARGITRWLGYELPRNFSRPYRAIGMRQFWESWHISLSTWFRDYVYIPLGGSRTGVVRTGVNLCATMLLSGLWHGANWTFVLWGGVHAGYLLIERTTNWPRWFMGGAGMRFGGRLLTFAAVVWAWVFFRAETVTEAVTISTCMLVDPTGGGLEIFTLLPPNSWLALFSFGCIVLGAKLWESHAVYPIIRLAVVVCGITVTVFLRGPGSTFIYFQF